jgi:hypothetical protein
MGVFIRFDASAVAGVSNPLIWSPPVHFSGGSVRKYATTASRSSCVMRL